MINFNKEIEQIKNQIIHKYKPDKIILFGSFARNDFNENSDIDMLIVKNTDKNKFERMCELRRMIDYEAPLDILVYTPDEMRTAIETNNEFYQVIDKEGIVLYEQ